MPRSRETTTEAKRDDPLKRRLQGVRKRRGNRRTTTSAVMASKLAMIENRRRHNAGR